MNNYIYSTGKRKTSIARVFLKEGNGEITINNNPEEKNQKFITYKIKKRLN